MPGTGIGRTGPGNGGGSYCDADEAAASAMVGSSAVRVASARAAAATDRRSSAAAPAGMRHSCGSLNSDMAARPRSNRIVPRKGWADRRRPRRGRPAEPC